MKAFADNRAILNDNAAYARVGVCGKASLARERERARHVKFVGHRLIL
ncbi:hypothetical protein BN133_3956 [Cronobacter dublinensis 582]|nr:hypothetical protein BN133_3956 [Cronobacter dublinensis 582]